MKKSAVLVLLALSILFQVASAQNFGLSAQLSTGTDQAGSHPNSVVAADIDGNGTVDLISANSGTGTLTIYTNDGHGDFGSNTMISVGGSLWQVIAVDVNGHGWPDIITTPTSSPVTVLTNDGTGVFNISATLPFGGVTIAAADTRGTGKMDLIVGNYSRNTFLVMTNDGSGQFGSNSLHAVYPSSFSIGSIATADINGDGKVDLITSEYGGNTLTVFTNDGTGGFGSNCTYTVGNLANTVIAADVNGDRKPDLVCANNGDNTVMILTNNGQGIFASNATYTVDSGVISVVATDVNGDGKMDLITANLNGSQSFTILTNDGTGKFVATSVIGPGNSGGCVLADLNGDGKPDLAGAMYSANEIAVFTNFYAFPAPASTPHPAIQPWFSGTAVRVSWPSLTAGWSLQQASDLPARNWSPGGFAGWPITDDGTNQSLIVTPPAGNQFFRLIHP